MSKIHWPGRLCRQRGRLVAAVQRGHDTAGYCAGRPPRTINKPLLSESHNKATNVSAEVRYEQDTLALGHLQAAGVAVEI
jgi:hypothetical protein